VTRGGSPGRRLARLLPGPRGAAAIRLARAGRDLILGRSDPTATAADRLRLERARGFLDAGDTDAALRELDRLGPLQAGPEASEIRRRAAWIPRMLGQSMSVDALRVDVGSAVEFLHRLGHPRPLVLLYHPASPGNPFQALLYSRAVEHGIAPIAVGSVADANRILATAPKDCEVGLHLHWLNRILLGATPGADADARIASFLAELDAFRQGGGRLVWTVHNVLPHDSPLPAEEAKLRRAVIERADVIHTMSPETGAAVADWYEIPAARALCVPLPAFDGAYEDTVDRAGARLTLGLAPDDLVYLFLGGLKAYKAWDDLVDAWRRLSPSEEPRRLVLAGSAGSDPATAAVLDDLARDPSVLLHARHILAAEMQLFLRAADVVVLPYREGLNSAVELLALTFGVPVIVPTLPGLSGVADAASSISFTPGNVPSLVDALARAPELRAASARASARRIAEQRAPAAVSADFAERLKAMLAVTKTPG
jgi:glycosyltransferase involved in cell wall biosynthesis